MAGELLVSSQTQRRLLDIAGSDLGLVGQDVNVAQPTEFLRYGRDEVVADQDVLVFFLHQLIARRHNHFHYVFACGKHVFLAEPEWIGRVGILHADGAVRAGCVAGRRVAVEDARELVQAVVRRRLQLIPVVQAVIALELGIVGYGVGRRTPVVVDVEVHGLVIQREIEQIGGGLARAVHVGHAIGAEALRPIVPTAGLGGVDQGEGLAAVRRRPLPVEVDGYARNERLPNVLGTELGVVKGTGRVINDMSPDTTVLPD